jgi:mRNA-degrading endonuclease RelE of RelBE toxin-antitoxin system
VNREILLSERAQREFEALDGRTRGRIRAGLERFARTGRGDLKKLKGIHGGPDLYRLRVGGHRMIFQLTPTEFRVTRIVPRSAGYDWL